MDQVMGIWLEENASAHSFIPESYWRDNFEAVRQGISQADVYVAEEGKEKIIGFIGIQDGYIAGIFVCSQYQGRGIGTALLEKAKREYAVLTLSVYEKNKTALHFYLKAGFQQESQGIDSATDQVELSMVWER
ncbi:MAG: GNAT family N-acetyltransferase [Clostridiales bacterium]|nr:GNAT family N-acetyltransferase [Clostridiales bacterium]